MRTEIAGIIAGLALCAGAQCPRGSYAFTHANVITVSGGTLSGANVVVCDGVITAVGSDAAVPSGAQVVDASGMTIYPGIVDGYSQYVLPSPPANAGRGGGGRGASGAQAIAAQNAEIANTLDGIPVNDPRRYIDPEAAGVASDRITAELLDPPATLEAVRDSGILASLVAPADGIFKGEAAVVDLVGPDAPAMLVKPLAGQVIELAPARGGYPSSTMGAVAVYRQTLLDAQRLRTEISIYEKAGEKGMPPPAY